MTPTSAHDKFDTCARQWHRQSLDHLPADTLARLRAARAHTGASARAGAGRRGWWLATACSALLAAGAAWHFTQLPSAPAGTAEEWAWSDGDGLALEENPELYLWLGADGALALEE